MKASSHTTPDISATLEFIETALHRRRRASDAPLSIDDVAELLRRVRGLWDELDMADYERRALADVMVRAPLSILDVTGRYVEIKCKWSEAIGFEVQLPQ
jgi:hypothetical protein